MDETARQRLRALILKARERQWNIDQDIDWSMRPRPNKWIPRSVAISVVSQLMHGELASAEMCRHLQEYTHHPEVMEFLEIQFAEESRHASAYKRYVAQLGETVDINPHLRIAFEAGYKVPGGAAGRIVACHIMLESEALELHSVLSESLRCSLLDQINRKIGLDEARHVAFGKIAAQHLVTSLPQETRDELANWAETVWMDCAKNLLSTLTGFAPLARRSLKARIESGWQRQSTALRNAGLEVQNSGRF